MSKYSESRILVRGLRRLPQEDRAAFKAKVLILRKHFQQFNEDVSDLCQWLLGLRPEGKRKCEEARAFWEFILEPESFLGNQNLKENDKFRLMAFQAASGIQDISMLASGPFPQAVRDSITYMTRKLRTEPSRRLFARLVTLSKPHQLILVKSSAEWIVSKYLRGYKNWIKHSEEWRKEKMLWEKEHQELTEEARNRFNEIFGELGVREKSPRICKLANLNELKDNCEFAGERFKGRNHSALCGKFDNFLNKLGQNQNAIKKYFSKNASEYLIIRRNDKRLSSGEAMEIFSKKNDKARHWFRMAWEDYLESLNLKEGTILDDYGGRLPHCLKFGDECNYNQHTNDCRRYKELGGELPQELQKLEPAYREWRKKYLWPPQRHQFRYPSARSLPTPKIFGGNFHEIDFKNSVLKLRLDDMPVGRYLELGFKPWPSDYDIQPDNATITSVHVNFIGSKARVGFRFEVAHKKARIALDQEKIDHLRSRKYPRQMQDQAFLDEVREMLIKSFQGEPEKEMRMVTVDLGTKHGYSALFFGESFKKAIPLKLIKIDKLYAETFSSGRDKVKNGAEIKDAYPKGKGVSKEHVALHLTALAEAAARIAEKRNVIGPARLGQFDNRRLTQHVRWMIRDWVRLNASQIIKLAEKEGADLIVFESMRGFSAPGRDKIDPEKKSRLGFFAFGCVKRKVAEKAVERGMRVVSVPYFYSSQVCAKCRNLQTDKKTWSDNKRKGKFECECKACDHKCHSDENAARVLGDVFWGKTKLPTNKLN